MNKTIENKLSKTLLCEDEFRHEWKKGEILHKSVFGDVYSAFLVDKGQIIAVKERVLECRELCHFSYIDDIDDARKVYYDEYKEEYNFFKELNHINIVKFLGTSFEEACTGWVWVVNIFMENITGTTINELLQKYGPVEEDRLRNYTRQITNGLNYLHNQNVVHRNVRSRNIMLMLNDVIKIINFDLAKRLEKRTKKNDLVCLNLAEFAPELIEGKKYGRRVDIWSLGSIVFEMTTGKPQPNTYTLTLSEDVNDFIKYCQNRNKHARPYACDLLNHKFLKNET